MTKEEMLAEIMDLGSTKKKRTKKVRPPKQAEKLSDRYKTRTDVSSIAPVQVIDSHEQLGIEPISPLKHLFPSSVLSKVDGGFGAETPSGQIDNSAKLGRFVNIPDGMFSYRDVAEFVGVSPITIVKIGGLLGFMKRIPGYHGYAPLNREQVKAIMHHLHCRKL